MKTHLKIYGLTIAAAARIQKRIEKNRSYHVALREQLHNQRVNEIRPEARAVNIAVGFIRGRTYSEIEMPLRPKDCGHISTHGRTRSIPNWVRVEELVREHGFKYYENEQAMIQKFQEFVDGGMKDVQ